MVISRRQVLTCRPAEPFAGPGNGWWVICHQHQPDHATIAVARVTTPSDPTVDLALLDLVADVPATITPAPVVRVQNTELVDDGWWAYGHPGGDPFGNTARGTVGAVLGYGYLRLDLNTPADDTPDDDAPDAGRFPAGFSGAGVWSPGRRAVVAVVTRRGSDGTGRALTLAHVRTHLPAAVFAEGRPPKPQPPKPRPSKPRPPNDLPEPGTLLGTLPAPSDPWVDRSALLSRIRDALTHDDVNGRRPVCLVGPGGAGKTQLAADHARRVAQAGEAVVAWITAETVTGLREGYAELGRRLGAVTTTEDSSTAARKTLAHLTRAPAPVLLVLDNVEALGVIEPYLPTHGPCQTLVTTRDRHTPFADVGHVIDVSGFEPSTAVDFLTRHTGIEPTTARTLTASVDGLPLALAVAADTVRVLRAQSPVGPITIGDIIIGDVTIGDKISADRGGIAAGALTGGALTHSAGPISPGVRATGPTTDPVEVILTQAVTSAVRLLPGASSVLTTLAVLGPDGTSPWILTHVTDHDDHAAAALGLLTTTGLLSTTDDGRLLVHRRTAGVIRDLDPPGTAAARARAATRLDALMSGRGASLRLTDADAEVLRHTHALVDSPDEGEDEGSLNRTASAEAARAVAGLADTMLTLLRRAGNGTDQIPLGENLGARLEKILGPDHPDTLTSRSHLAVGYRRMGRIREAVALDEATLATRSRVLGPDHPDTLTSRNNLAVDYQATGRIDDAITLDETTLTARSRVLGPDHPDTLTSRNNLAACYRAVGRIDEAITLDETTLTAMERVLGPDHPDTLGTRNNLAIDYRAVGRIDEAITLDETTLTAMERVLGPDHPDTLGTRNNLAIDYWAGHRLDDAIALDETTLATRSRVLGPDHPDTLTSRNNLALDYQAGHRFDDAIALHKTTLATRSRVLGPDHPDTQKSRDNLAACYRAVHR